MVKDAQLNNNWESSDCCHNFSSHHKSQ